MSAVPPPQAPCDVHPIGGVVACDYADAYCAPAMPQSDRNTMTSQLDFFVCTLKLLRIIDRVPLAEAHFLKSGVNSGQALGSVLDMNSDLDQFCEELPQHLRANTASISSSRGYRECFELQANVLRARCILSFHIASACRRCANDDI